MPEASSAVSAPDAFVVDHVDALPSADVMTPDADTPLVELHVITMFDELPLETTVSVANPPTTVMPPWADWIASIVDSALRPEATTPADEELKPLGTDGAYLMEVSTPALQAIVTGSEITNRATLGLCPRSAQLRRPTSIRARPIALISPLACEKTAVGFGAATASLPITREAAKIPASTEAHSRRI